MMEELIMTILGQPTDANEIRNEEIVQTILNDHDYDLTLKEAYF
jgi:hypothetical protein